MPLVIFGLLVSIPIIVWGSQLVIKLMDRFPMIITLGGMLLGWIAGTMAVTDPAVASPDGWAWVPKLPQTDAVRYAAGLAGALLVLGWGVWPRGGAPRPDEARGFNPRTAGRAPRRSRAGPHFLGDRRTNAFAEGQT